MRLFLITLLLCCLSLTPGRATNITKIEGKATGWNIETRRSVYQLRLDGAGGLYPVFWGNRARAEELPDQDRKRANGPFRLDEVPVRGKYADKQPIVEVVFADQTRDCELTLVSTEVIEIEGRETLKIVQRDKHYPLEVTSFLRVLPEYDLIEKWMEVTNIARKGKETIRIENLLSGSAMLPADRYFLNHHSGQWFREYQLRKTELTTGVKSLLTRDFFSFANTPWFAVTNTPGNDERHAEVWFGQVEYSGNWRLDFESTHSNHLQIVGGINFWDTELALRPGQSFTTPKLSIGYTDEGAEDAAQLSQAYTRREVLPQNHRDQLRPILYNSWYATAFDVNEEQQLALAKRAKEIGVEVFVIDDGWFKGRKSDNAGLGDWTVDAEKFPNGLQSMIGRINELGLDFGIWVEPEMVNPNSDLYRKHPDWVLSFPNRERTEWRNQLTLNLAREDVYQYLLSSMSELLSQNNIKFIKWDRNRGLTQPGWEDADASVRREVRIRYMENLYRLIDTLRARFPEVIFENCSSGGGRPDLGMLRRMDQTWASDNTDPVDRLFIQYGYLSAWPANTMVCWTNRSDYHRAGLSLDYTFDVAMQGVLGIGQDITKWNDKEMSTAKRKIAEYKQIRDLVQQGKADRLLSPFEGNRVAVQYTAEDASRSVVCCYNLAETMEGSTDQMRASQLLRLRSLDPSKNYRIDNDPAVYSGEYLMQVGIRWQPQGAFKSTLIRITEL